MNRDLLIYIQRFIILVLVQVLLLNNVQFSGLLNPYLYLYFLLLLPVDFSPNFGLILAFFLGLTIDRFSQTLGMHTIATVFAAFARPYILRYMAPRDGYEFSRVPSIRDMGWIWFLTYCGIITFLHHFMLFFVESFKMSGFVFTVSKSLGSTALTIFLVAMVQLLFARLPKSA